MKKIDQKLATQKIEVDDESKKYLTSEFCLFVYSILPKIKQKSGQNGQEWHNQKEWRIFQICHNNKFDKDLERKAKLAKPNSTSYTEINFGKDSLKNISLCLCKDNKVKKLLKNYHYKETTTKRRVIVNCCVRENFH